MSIEALFKDRTIKAKGKVKTLGEWLFDISCLMPKTIVLWYAGQLLMLYQKL
ncbi:hypothetical protein [Sphingobacterium thalpophilum]|uniref:hypothetical protein n=1 Tax=Sphingobacterium thalpophilum TaxID=259 RepID=UPI001E5298A5|nr:hypothetical protein [Sphingobacterium thalpophilum]